MKDSDCDKKRINYSYSSVKRLSRALGIDVVWFQPFTLIYPSHIKPGIERVQVLADISRSALCCHSNETRAPIANPPNCAQLEGTPCHSPNYIRVRWVECGNAARDRQTHRRPWPLYISPRLHLTRNVMSMRMHNVTSVI